MPCGVQWPDTVPRTLYFPKPYILMALNQQAANLVDTTVTAFNSGTVATLVGEDDEPETGMDDPTGSDGGSGGMDPDNEPSETAENNSAMGMDDDTGSQGGMRPPSKSSHGSDATGDDYGTNSATQRSGVSGGSADSGSGSSGGRSQY